MDGSEKPLLSTIARRRLLRLAPDVLFHGTRYLSAIMSDNELGVPSSGMPAVFLTRDPEVAAYWANLAPREWDDGRGGIIALDRKKLNSSHRITPYRYGDPHDEAEEYIDAPLQNLDRYVLEVFWLDDLVSGAGIMPPCIPLSGAAQVPAVTFHALAQQVQRLQHMRTRTSDLAFEEAYAGYIESLDRWIGVE